MERNSLSSSLRDHSIRDCNNNTTTTTTTKISTSHNNNKMMLKDSWTCSNSTQEDYISGFSWPPRCYTCSFCKREFRSAQALGGHMNVHRRDRARLRQSPPPPPPPPPPNSSHGQYAHAILNLNLNPNPNPNYSTSPASPSIFTTSLPSLVSPPISALSSSPSSASPPAQPPSELKKWVVDSASFLDPSSPKSDGSCKFFKTSTALALVDHSVRLDLEMGQVSHESKEDLDLELRLGSYC